MGLFERKITIDPKEATVLNYLTDEGAGFETEICEAIQECWCVVGPSLESLAAKRLVTRTQSEFFPEDPFAVIFKPTERGFKQSHGQ